MPVLKAREKLGAGVNEMCCIAIMKFDIERLTTREHAVMRGVLGPQVVETLSSFSDRFCACPVEHSERRGVKYGVQGVGAAVYRSSEVVVRG